MVSFVDEEEAFDVILKHVEPGIKKTTFHIFARNLYLAAGQAGDFIRFHV